MNSTFCLWTFCLWTFCLWTFCLWTFCLWTFCLWTFSLSTFCLSAFCLWTSNRSTAYPQRLPSRTIFYMCTEREKTDFFYVHINATMTRWIRRHDKVNKGCTTTVGGLVRSGSAARFGESSPFGK
jgi:hypothetical protein